MATIDWVHLEDESGRCYGNGRIEIDPIPEPLLWAVSEDMGTPLDLFVNHYLTIIACHELAHYLGEEHLDDGLTWNIAIEKGLRRFNKHPCISVMSGKYAVGR